MKQDSLAMLSSATTTLTFGSIKIHVLVKKKMRFQRRFSINVRAGIINEPLIRLYVLLNWLNAAHYLEFLNNVLDEQMDVEVLLGEWVYMWHLHDGPPSHFARPLSGWLNNHFPNQWKLPSNLASGFTRCQSVWFLSVGSTVSKNYRRVSTMSGSSNRYSSYNSRSFCRQVDGNGRLLFSYCRRHKTSRKHKSGHSSDGLDYNTSFAYIREVKNHHLFLQLIIFRTDL